MTQTLASPATAYDIYPLDAPGMPTPGEDLLRLAIDLGDDTELEGKGRGRRLSKVGALLKGLYRRILYSHGNFEVPITIKGHNRKSMRVLTGHIWGAPEDDVHYGPRPSPVMVIGKMLGDEEQNECRQLIGPSGQLLRESCERFNIPHKNWYVTNVMKTAHPDPASNGTLKSGWITEWLPLLHQELRLVRPKYILCLGADAAKALLGKQIRKLLDIEVEGLGPQVEPNITNMEGRVVTMQIPLARTEADLATVEPLRVAVMVIPHPAAVLREPHRLDVFENALCRFGQLTRGLRWDREEEGLDHRVIDTLDELENLYHEIQADCEDNLIAVDCEWHGEHPNNSGSYLRTIQLSWKPKAAVCISLRHPGGAERFQGGIPAALELVRKICKGRRYAGHFANADMEWLLYNDVDLREELSVADNWLECMEDAIVRNKGGFDTAYAAHAFEETADFALTPLALRFTTAPRYDIPLTEWKKRYCADNDLKDKDLDGYGMCPDDILEPYACYDADVTRRLVKVFEPKLSCDRFGNNCWEAFWMTMRANPAILEINTTGLPIDRGRMETLTEMYQDATVHLQQKIRDYAKWPEFNLNSVLQTREFLYGEALNGKEREPGQPPIRLRPEGAVSLYLEPIMDTSKRPMQWKEVVERGLVDERSPSTNKMALGILAQEATRVSRVSPDGTCYTEDLSEPVTWMRNYRFISHVLKSSLRLPVLDDAEEYVLDRLGNKVYPGGLPAAICDDGRVRTTIYPVKETGRWSSARPPLQNLAKRREGEYKSILGPVYRWPIRTMIRAPEGHCYIEADYIGAELFLMAIMSGDKTMIDHAMRNQLKEDDPNYYDIHSNIAVLAFGYKCPPTKGGLASIGKKDMRIVAKAVIFGVAYGRGAKAIALAAREEKVFITQEEAQQVIDTIFQMYPGLVPYFNKCKARARNERWLCGPFGRFRRFPRALDEKSIKDFEREAMNSLIQGGIADAMTRAVDHLYHYREDHSDVDYRIVLQIHDAVLLQVPVCHVPRVIDEVLPTCLCKRVPIYPTDVDGSVLGTGPYYLGVDVNPYVHWGEELNPDQCLALGLHPKYAHWQECGEGWTHPEKSGKIWLNGKLEKLK